MSPRITLHECMPHVGRESVRPSLRARARAPRDIIASRQGPGHLWKYSWELHAPGSNHVSQARVLLFLNCEPCDWFCKPIPFSCQQLISSSVQSF